jgi:hypothetical protein
VDGGGGGLTVSGMSRNHGGFVKCVAIQKKVVNPRSIVLTVGLKLSLKLKKKKKFITKVMQSEGFLKYHLWQMGHKKQHYF